MSLSLKFPTIYSELALHIATILQADKMMTYF